MTDMRYWIKQEISGKTASATILSISEGDYNLINLHCRCVCVALKANKKKWEETQQSEKLHASSVAIQKVEILKMKLRSYVRKTCSLVPHIK